MDDVETPGLTISHLARYLGVHMQAHIAAPALPEPWLAEARAAAAFDAELLLERVMAVAAELGGAPKTQRPTLALLPAALLLRTRDLIFKSNSVLEKISAVNSTCLTLLAHVVGDLLGLPTAYNLELAGQRLTDHLDKSSDSTKYCYRLAALQKAHQMRERRRCKNDKLTEADRETQRRVDAADFERLRLEPLNPETDVSGWYADPTPQRRSSGSAAANAASYSCTECAQGRPREAELRRALDAASKRAAAAEAALAHLHSDCEAAKVEASKARRLDRHLAQLLEQATAVQPDGEEPQEARRCCPRELIGAPRVTPLRMPQTQVDVANQRLGIRRRTCTHLVCFPAPTEAREAEGRLD